MYILKKLCKKMSFTLTLFQLSHTIYCENLCYTAVSVGVWLPILHNTHVHTRSVYAGSFTPEYIYLFNNLSKEKIN